MQDILNQLETFSKKPKINKTDAKDISDLLIQIYQTNNETLKISEWLMKFQLEATQMFFLENYSTLNGNDLDALIKDLISLDLFKKNTRDCSVNRAIVIVNICFENNNYSDTVGDLFVKMIELVVKKNAIKSSFLTSFNKKIIDNTDYNFLKLNFKQDDKPLVFLLIHHLSTEGFFDINSQEFLSSNIYDEYITKKDELIQTIKSTPAKTTKKSVDTNELAESIKNLQLITDKLSQSLNEDFGTISNLKSKVSEQDLIIEKNTQDLIDEKNRTDELTKKLELSFQMDKSTADQDLLTLKTDISNGLKFEYDTFNENIDCECDDDNFEAYKGTITRIFRTLKRLGITFE